MTLSIPSASASQWKHDVFLSFRGETRQGFVSHLFDALESTGRIKTFKDDQRLEVGKAISQNLLLAIEESRFAVVVLSPNYASSPWCLDELTKILETMEGRDRILPIFYHVDPSHVRHQLGSFAEAFTKHVGDSRQSKKKINRWRLALKNVAALSGWDLKNFRTEGELVRDIVKFLSAKVVQNDPQLLEEFTVTSTKDFIVEGSTREAVNELIKALRDDKLRVIAVYGIEGVGKTVMVRHVSAEAQRIGIFHQLIMVTVPQCYTLKMIQTRLMDQLGLQLWEEDEEVVRAARILETIMRGSKILIILDDMRDMIALSSIGIPSYNELKKRNSKIIITTRILNVCNSMGSQATIPLNPLSEEDSVNLIMTESLKSVHESTKFLDVAREIAKRCAGLLDAMRRIAWALRYKGLDEWVEAARQLKSSPTANLDEYFLFQSLSLSYDYLNSDDARALFLLCCLFPEDYEIPIEDLFKYAIGRGLLRYAHTIKAARSTTYSEIRCLKTFGLLSEGTKEGCIRMHGLFRQIAMSIALSKNGDQFLVKSGYELQDWPKMNMHNGCTAISLMNNQICELPENLVCPKLQILLLQNNAGIYEIPESFFQCLNELEVLDLSFTSISLLPQSLSLLCNLHALYLDYCNNIIDISIFGHLRKLEIFSMKEFPLKELPGEIGDLTNLRMLDISGSNNIGRIPSKLISRLYGLEELYMQGNFGDWGSEVEGGVGDETNAGFDELTGLSNLSSLKVCISDVKCLPENVIFDLNWIDFDICISRESICKDFFLKPNSSHSDSRTLTLSSPINSLPDWFIKGVTEKTETLRYLKCKRLKNILVEYVRGRLHRLQYLTIIGAHENLEVLMKRMKKVPNKPVFQKLEELHLLGVSCLKELCIGELPPGSLCSLKLIKVEYCHDLVSALLPSNLWQKLQNLEKLMCEEMNGMEYVFGSAGLVQEQFILIKLREMKLWNLEKLIRIWNGPAPDAVFQNVRSLTISGCKKLKSLFPYNVGQSLLQLEDLLVTECPSLDRVIEPSKDAMNKKIIFPELKNLALSYLPQLIWFCSNGSATIVCPLLEHLHVQDCPHFRTSISDFHSWKQFYVNDLRHLRISKDTVTIHSAGQQTMDILESLPQNIRKRVEVIRQIQRQHDELWTKFLKERAALEANYQKLYQQLYKKRYMIVNGVVEVDGVTTEAAVNQEDKASKERGVCNFWLNALKNNDVLANQITERDERALKYLKDIKESSIHNPKGFELEFCFDTNPFLKNSILTKTYHMTDEGEPQKAVGTEIEWYPAKCLTQRILKEKSKKGSKSSRPLTRTENCGSFFNFFSPPQVPEDDADIAEELKKLMKHDYDIGSTIRYKIIPHAVSWFTGEAF